MTVKLTSIIFALSIELSDIILTLTIKVLVDIIFALLLKDHIQVIKTIQSHPRF